MKIISETFKENHSIRIILIDEKEWFVSKDIAVLLGYTNPQKAIRDHCKKSEAIGSFKGVNDSFTLDPQTKIIPESDVWRLIVKSRLPEAEKIEEWIMEEVLPQIRKTGSYSLQNEVLEIENFPLSEMLSETKTALEIVDLVEKEKPFRLLILERILKEKSPTKLLGIDFSKSYFLPTELGILIGVSGAEMNLILAEKGYQFRDENGIWRPTENGKKFCIELGGKFSQLKWKLEVLV
jgi:prophage antirepressor-like protein